MFKKLKKNSDKIIKKSDKMIEEENTQENESKSEELRRKSVVKSSVDIDLNQLTQQLATTTLYDKTKDLRKQLEIDSIFINFFRDNPKESDTILFKRKKVVVSPVKEFQIDSTGSKIRIVVDVKKYDFEKINTFIDKLQNQCGLTLKVTEDSSQQPTKIEFELALKDENLQNFKKTFTSSEGNIGKHPTK